MRQPTVYKKYLSLCFMLVTLLYFTVHCEFSPNYDKEKYPCLMSGVCPDGYICDVGVCVPAIEEPCIPESHAGTICHDGKVYFHDSCGGLEELVDSCSDSGTCHDGACCVPKRDCAQEGLECAIDQDDGCGGTFSCSLCSGCESLCVEKHM
jgi:hypothetical protein